MDDKSRCFGSHNPVYARYHDEEWGVPIVGDDRLLFEMLILEGAHAGLSWETVLMKREGYRDQFHHFDVDRVMAMTDAELDAALTNPNIVRHRLKVYSTRKNAHLFRTIQQEFGSFSNYLWGHTPDQKPIVNNWADHSQVPGSTTPSDQISKDLKKRGMSFVGTTIIYAFLQAVGVVNDHISTCWRYNESRG